MQKKGNKERKDQTYTGKGQKSTRGSCCQSFDLYAFKTQPCSTFNCSQRHAHSFVNHAMAEASSL